jgi:hypothetical protein
LLLLAEILSLGLKIKDPIHRHICGRGAQ